MRNIGHIDAAAVSGELQCGSPYVTLLDGLADFGSIPAGGSGSNAQPLLFELAGEIPDGSTCDFLLLLNEEPGARDFTLIAHAPAYFLSVVEIDDAAFGNGDGVPDPGEAVDLRLGIENVGSSAAPPVNATLLTPTDYYVPSYTAYPLPEMLPGDRLETEPFGVAIGEDCPPHHADYLELRLRDGEAFDVHPPFVFCTGQAFADDFETAAASWRHRALPGGWQDEWHREALRNHTPGGETSWKCGGAGDWSYGNLLHAALETGDFPLPADAWLEFWQWIDAETSEAYPEYAYDGGRIEISTDGGESWTALTPEGGYPYLIREGSVPGPFPVETPVWSGQQDWHLVRVDLGAYTGVVRLRWLFGSDGAVVREGWYIDDLRVGVGWPSAAPGGSLAVGSALRLLPARPNPLAAQAAGVTVEFALAHAGPTRLAVYDAAGRCVRTLCHRTRIAGRHRISWDGRDARGHPAPAGRYYLRLEAGGATAARSLLLVQ
ncbi:MAG: hypothetical protein GF330_11415 [Candidatus Eisenbacteria bacterium]|nr:hypothetical protein [Candidatus Eisenbacteria bacterium]